MTRIAAYVVLILAVFVISSTTPAWLVGVPVRGSAPANLARQLGQGDPSTPSAPMPLIQGRKIYIGACGACHGSGSIDFGIGLDTIRIPHAYSPRDVHRIITWGDDTNYPAEFSYTGRPIIPAKDHPAFNSRLTDIDRWAVSLYVYSGLIETEYDVVDAEWIERWRTKLDRSSGPGTSGAEIYQRSCAQCHGTYGYGNGPLAFDLKPPPADLRNPAWLASQSDDYLMSVITWGNSVGGNETLSGMPPWGEILERAEIMRVTDCIRSYGYSLDITGEGMGPRDEESGAVRYQVIIPDSNLWSWDEIRAAIPDAPEEPPEWYDR